MIRRFFRVPLIRLSATLWVLLASLPARAGALAIDEENGCKQGKAQETAKKFCSDFEAFESFKSEPSIQNAKAECLKFYEQALRVQNVFCSYRTDAVIFQVFSAVKQESSGNPLAQVLPEVAKQNVSQQAVARDNRKVAEINKAYMDKLRDLMPRLQKAHAGYFQAINVLSADAGSDLTSEAACVAENIRSTIPAYIREILSGIAFGKMQTTTESLTKAIRENHRLLAAVKAEAEENATIAEMRNLETGGVNLEGHMKNQPEPSDRIKLPNSYASANPWVQYVGTKVTQLVKQDWGKGAGVVGAGSLILFQWATGQTVSMGDRALMLTGILSPVSGLTAGFLAQVYKDTQEVQKKYREMCQNELRKNSQLDNLQLMTIWGERTDPPRPQCKQAAEAERRCIAFRQANPRQAYDNGPCRRGFQEHQGPGAVYAPNNPAARYPVRR